MSRYQDEVQYLSLSVLVRKITAKAVLVILQDDRKETWIPQSCLSAESLAEIGEGVVTDINVAAWFCQKEGLL